MVTFPSYELSIHNFVALVSHETVERFDDMFQVNTLGNRIGPVLALRTTVVVVGALEDEAHALGHKTDVTALSPTHKKEGQLTETIIVAHIVHGIPPTVQGAVQGFATRGFDGAAFDASQPLETRVLGLPNGIIKVKLSGKIPLAIICVLATDIISVKGEKGLVRRHAGGTGV